MRFKIAVAQKAKQVCGGGGYDGRDQEGGHFGIRSHQEALDRGRNEEEKWPMKNIGAVGNSSQKLQDTNIKDFGKE